MRLIGRLLALSLLLATIGCDRVTKYMATTRLAGKPEHSYFGGFLRFTYAENSGAFLGLGSSLPDWARTSLLTVGAAAALVVVAVAARKMRWSGLPLMGAVLFFAGGASNLIDRVIRGSVVDFMIIGVGSLRTGIFNVADVALMVGVGFMLLGERRFNQGSRA